MLTAISELLAAALRYRNWQQFKNLEVDFVSQYGVDVWEDVFNFRLKPALDKNSDRWLLIQKCSTGIKSVKIVA